MTKNVLIFSDGTGQAGGQSLEERRSNIYKLYRATRGLGRFDDADRRDLCERNDVVPNQDAFAPPVRLYELPLQCRFIEIAEQKARRGFLAVQRDDNVQIFPH